MENTINGAMVPLDTEWRDLGSWSTLYDVKTKDINGNVSEGDVILEAVSDTYTYSSNRLISAIGISGIVIIDTPDALLIADKKYVQNINNIVQKLIKDNRSEVNNHKKVYRPWGSFEVLLTKKNYQVKKLIINPQQKISLQKHLYRSENWIIVQGKAKITKNNKNFKLVKNQSISIPKKTIHRIENIGKETLIIIEVQSGERLLEEDIIRLEDIYNRD